ncbi:MAG TPA: hypothetical protein VFW96_25210 [Thermomicrobiales bacterium]|nr:hypothetical protein [Thermomicrobiales bacterium]
MIRVCGGLADEVTAYVCARLEYEGDEYRLLDLGRYPEGYAVRWAWEEDGPVGEIAGPGWRLDLAEITAVYARDIDARGHALAATAGVETAGAVLGECQAGVAALLEQLPCPVVNRGAGMAANMSKPFQLGQIARAGLGTPRTLVTSDPEAARAFCAECGGDVIFKSLSGVRSLVRRVAARDLARLPLLRHGPAQFQQFVPGDNIRVHTVGDEIFATRIRTAAVDYRYARGQGHALTMEPARLPGWVEAACRALAAGSGLLLAGIDLKETPEGEYVCFEVNPSPGFVWFERRSGQPISAALAALLRRGGRVIRREGTAARAVDVPA